MPRLTINEAIILDQWPTDLELVDEPLAMSPWLGAIIGPIVPQMSVALQTQIEFFRRLNEQHKPLPHNFPEAKCIYAYAYYDTLGSFPIKSLVFFYRHVERTLTPATRFVTYWTLHNRSRLSVEMYEIIADIYDGLDCQDGSCVIAHKLPTAVLARLRRTTLKVSIVSTLLSYEEAIRETAAILVSGLYRETWIKTCQKAQKIFVMSVACSDGILRVCDSPKVPPWHAAMDFERLCEMAKMARAVFFFRVVSRLPMELQMRIIAMLLPTTYDEHWGQPQRYFHIEDADLAWLRS